MGYIIHAHISLAFCTKQTNVSYNHTIQATRVPSHFVSLRSSFLQLFIATFILLHSQMKKSTFTISLAALIMFLMEWVLSCSNLRLTTMTSKLLDKGYSMNTNFKRIWMMMIIIVISGQSKLYHYSSFSTVLCVA